MNNVEIYFGPPGTGKTTKLIDIVEERLARGLPPEKVVYVSFTNKAADEAARRVSEKFPGLRFPFFRTIHSLCFQALGLSRNSIMNRATYQQLGLELDLELSAQVDSQGYVQGTNHDDKLLFCDNYARITRTTLGDAYDHINPDFDFVALEIFAENYADFKETRGLFDYTDILDHFIKAWDGELFPQDILLIVDEAQDLSRLQWLVIECLMENAKWVVIAGDDDQAIYQWAGASVDDFLGVDGTKVVLDQSYRIPRLIHDLADELIAHVDRRQPKLWKPRGEEGTIKREHGPQALDLDDGAWLLLARHHHHLQEYEELCQDRGYYYALNKRPSIPRPIINAIIAFEKSKQQLELLPEDFALLQKYFPNGSLVGNWFDKIEGVSDDQIEYIRATRRRGESLVKPPRINISTIHGVKGGEADHVALRTDMTRRTYSEYELRPSPELRVFYVGITRAKQSLTFIEPAGRNYLKEL